MTKDHWRAESLRELVQFFVRNPAQLPQADQRSKSGLILVREEVLQQVRIREERVLLCPHQLTDVLQKNVVLFPSHGLSPQQTGCFPTIAPGRRQERITFSGNLGIRSNSDRNSSLRGSMAYRASGDGFL